MRPLPLLVFSLLSTLVLGSAASARAATLFVEPSGVTPFTDIQAAIDAAVDGDAILVFPGTYGPIVVDALDVTVRSVGGPSLTIIDATGSGAPAAVFSNDVPSTALLHGFTLTGGVGFPDDNLTIAVGGGVYVSRDSSPRISGNVIVGNSAVAGAGIAVTAGEPHIYGNVIRGNTASGGVGGVLLTDPAGQGFAPLFACNQVLGNTGTTVGGVLVSGGADLHNNVVHGNVGERGGVWLAVGAVGTFANNTITTNEAIAGNAGGVEVSSADVVAVGNLVAFNLVGVGVLHSIGSPAWTYGDLYGNGGGAWSGASPDPTGTNGNISFEPQFTTFTTTNPLDDDLSLLAFDPMLNLGSPDPAYADLDGSRGAVGVDGGPRLGCDGDGDGVRVGDSPPDCRPDEGAFFPGAYELEGGTDNDCDGFGTLSLFELVSDDGGLVPVGAGWEFGLPSYPGRGAQSVSAWCTGCASGAGASFSDELELSLDLSSLTAGTGAQLQLLHAYSTDSGDGGIVELFGTGWAALTPLGGYPGGAIAAFPGAPGVWSGDSAGYVEDRLDLSAEAGTVAETRFRYASQAGSTAPGWTIGRLALLVEDADGDGRAAGAQDCDDSDDTVYVGAPEVPYDTLDQDCDGSDLVDVDGDGYDAVTVGGDDCDDSDPDANPLGVEVPYDGIDQDCSGADFDDVDGDGAASWEVGGPDCDDGDDEIGPAVLEIPYDGVDQDCSGDDLTDVDGDGFRGDQPAPFGDCDDTNAAVNPDEDEVCDDGLDNDCNDLLDEELDFDEDGYDRCAGDCDEGSVLVNPGQDEICDGVDTDCDGVPLPDEVDFDGDGELVCAGDCNDLNVDVGLLHPEVCDGIDNDCDGAVDEDQDGDGDGFSGCSVDCDDQRSSVYPGAALDCADNIDHDCNGVRDFEQEECVNPPSGCSTSPGGASWFGILLLPLLLRRRARSVISGP